MLVERLSEPKGIALPGGRRDMINGKLEDVASCAIREFEEETGLTLIIEGMLGRYDDLNRDPRGPKISDVVYGRAYGTLKNEPNKTKAFTIDYNKFNKYKEKFVFDHYNIINDWYKEYGGRK